MLYSRTHIGDKIKVQCNNGLCDRLAMIFSYLKKAQQEKDKLTVCWLVNDGCDGHFLDFFDPVNDINFTTDEKNVDFLGWKPYKSFLPSEMFVYHDLKVLKVIEDKIENMRSEMNDDYVSVHVRRTDKADNNGLNSLTSDKDFFRFIDGFQKEKKIFLATDNAKSQRIFRNRYGDRLVCSSQINSSNDMRQTPLETSVIDLFTSMWGDEFKGTNLSGFSHFINQFRKHEQERAKIIKSKLKLM